MMPLYRLRYSNSYKGIISFVLVPLMQRQRPMDMPNIHCSKYLKDRTPGEFSTDNGAMHPQFRGYLLSVDNNSKFLINLSFFKEGRCY